MRATLKKRLRTEKSRSKDLARRLHNKTETLKRIQGSLYYKWGKWLHLID